MAAGEIGKDLGSSDMEQLRLAALLQDLGILILDIVDDGYSKAIYKMQENHTQLQTVEKRLYQVDHAEVGAYMLGRWLFPEQIVGAVYHSHERHIDECPSGFSQIVAASGYIADVYLSSYSHDERQFAHSILTEVLNLTSNTEHVLISIINRVTESAKPFNMKVELSEKEQQELLERADDSFCQFSGALPKGLSDTHRPSAP